MPATDKASKMNCHPAKELMTWLLNLLRSFCTESLKSCQFFSNVLRAGEAGIVDNDDITRLQLGQNYIYFLLKSVVNYRFATP
jgi:hypothetical protein